MVGHRVILWLVNYLAVALLAVAHASAQTPSVALLVLPRATNRLLLLILQACRW